MDKNKNTFEIKKEIEKTIKQDFLIVVEGKKDKSCLEYLGFNSKDIFVLNIKGSLKEKIEKIAEKAGKRKVLILTDFDYEGKKLYYQIKKDLVRKGIRISDSLRQTIIKEKISHIEGLARYLDEI